MYIWRRIAISVSVFFSPAWSVRCCWPQWSWLLSTGLVLAAKVLFGIWAVGKISFSFVRRRGTSGRFKRQTPRRMDGHHLSFPVTVCTVERPGLRELGRGGNTTNGSVCVRVCVCTHLNTVTE